MSHSGAHPWRNSGWDPREQQADGGHQGSAKPHRPAEPLGVLGVLDPSVASLSEHLEIKQPKVLVNDPQVKEETSWENLKTLN